MGKKKMEKAKGKKKEKEEETNQKQANNTNEKQTKGEIADIMDKTTRYGKPYKLLKLADMDKPYFVWNPDMLNNYNIGDQVKIDFSGQEYFTVEKINKTGG